MKPMSVEYHRPTGLWQVFDDEGRFLVAFATERLAVQFARCGQVTIYDF